MSAVRDLLATLNGLNIRVSAAGGELRVAAPKGALTPELRAELSLHKAELIGILERSTEYALSFAQTRLWFLTQLDGASNSAYNLPNAWEIRGPLNVAAMQRALSELVRRHQVLRTTYSSSNGTPVQTVRTDLRFELPVVEVRESEIRQALDDDAVRPFDLARDPMLRASLLRVSPERHVLMANLHHIAFDGWSMSVFVRELTALYRGLPLPEPSFQYSDYAALQRQRLAAGKMDAGIAYWTERLAGLPPRLELPTRARHSDGGFTAGVEPIAIDEATSQLISQWARRAGATPFMAVLAALAAVLFRYTGRDDIAVGSPVANRNTSAEEGLIGFLVNILVFRVDLSGNPAFRELLARVRSTTLGAYEHREVPFEKLVEALHPERSVNHSPLFQVMLDWQSAPHGSWDLPGLTVTPVPNSAVVGRFDISLTMEDSPAGLRGRWEFNADLFEPALIARMSSHLQNLLAAAAGDPDAPVSTAPMLSAAERRQILEDWNRTSEAPYLELPVHRQFEEWARRTPDAVAILDRGQEITYRELDGRANLLARNLAEFGVGPEVPVGLRIQRSAETLIGMLGILKAGGTFLPMDPGLPPARVEAIMRDAGSEVLVTDRNFAAKVNRFCRYPVAVDDVQGRADNPGFGPGRLAYVIYTSGSTGKPKGVAVEHRALASFVAFAVREYGIGRSDRVLQFASAAFDASLEEIFPCLACGATLVLRNDEMLVSPERFWAQCRDWATTVLDLPTAYWHQLTAGMSEQSPSLPESLRLVIIGGERALAENLRRWNSRAPFRPRLVNTYGPTEATVVATFFDLTGATPDEIPIGRPVDRARVYVLDSFRQPVPAGVSGELFIGGDNLALGYLNSPELTRERFIESPFRAGDRLYKTGDLARWRSDGQLEFVGRIDSQVKIRGYRIELGEIEAVLAQHPLVVAAVAGVHNEQLAAWVVAPTATTGHLRRFLRHSLPPYMVPDAWVFVDEIPLTPQGKVDRRALPAPGASDSDQAYVAPRDETERRLAELWAEVLRLPRVGIRDGFFDLGGHSMLAYSLLSRIEQVFGRGIPLSSFFLGATVEQAAEVLRGGTGEAGTWSQIVRLQPRGSMPPLFLVHPGGGNLLAYTEFAGHLDPSRPVYGLEARGFEAGQAPDDRVEAMAAEYVNAVRSVQPEGTYRLAGWCLGGAVAFEMARMLHACGERVEFLGLVDSFIRAGEQPLDPFALMYGLFVQRYGFPVSIDALRHLGVDGALERAYEKAKLAGRFDAGMDLPRLRRIHNVLMAHERAAVQYEPRRYPGTLTLFRPTGGQGAEAAAGGENADRGWGKFVAEVDLRWVPGGHLTMFHDPYGQRLAAELDLSIRQAETSLATAAAG